MDRCTDISSALKYNFEGSKKVFYYYDHNKKELTRNKYGNDFYCDHDNQVFRRGEFRKVIVDDEVDYVQAFDLGTITMKNINCHNIIARMQYSEE